MKPDHFGSWGFKAWLECLILHSHDWESHSYQKQLGELDSEASAEHNVIQMPIDTVPADTIAVV